MACASHASGDPIAVPVAEAEVELRAQHATPCGNVIDMSEGFRKAVLRLEKRYGSSGGVEDDPLAELQAAARERGGK